jgi:hypothetical protein
LDFKLGFLTCKQCEYLEVLGSVSTVSSFILFSKTLQWYFYFLFPFGSEVNTKAVVVFNDVNCFSSFVALVIYSGTLLK